MRKLSSVKLRDLEVSVLQRRKRKLGVMSIVSRLRVEPGGKHIFTAWFPEGSDRWQEVLRANDIPITAINHIPPKPLLPHRKTTSTELSPNGGCGAWLSGDPFQLVFLKAQGQRLVIKNSCDTEWLGFGMARRPKDSALGRD